MTRPLRILYPNAFYHVTCRGNNRRVEGSRGVGQAFILLYRRSCSASVLPFRDRDPPHKRRTVGVAALTVMRGNQPPGRFFAPTGPGYRFGTIGKGRRSFFRKSAGISCETF